MLRIWEFSLFSLPLGGFPTVKTEMGCILKSQGTLMTHATCCFSKFDKNPSN